MRILILLVLAGSAWWWFGTIQRTEPAVLEASKTTSQNFAQQPQHTDMLSTDEADLGVSSTTVDELPTTVADASTQSCHARVAQQYRDLCNAGPRESKQQCLSAAIDALLKKGDYQC